MRFYCGTNIILSDVRACVIIYGRRKKTCDVMCVVWTWRVHGRTSQHKLPAAAARRHKRTAPSNQPPVVVAQTGHRDTHATRNDARRAQRQPSSSVPESTCACVSDDADDDDEEDDNKVQVDSVTTSITYVLCKIFRSFRTISIHCFCGRGRR